MRTSLRWVAIAMAGVAMLVGSAGCLSTHPGSRSIAYVDITSHGIDAVHPEVIRVFADESYRLTDSSDGRLVFEREATQRDQVMFGTYGEHLSMRVVVLLESRRQGGTLVRADAYALHDRHATQVMRIARRPYQDLLNRVKASLVKAGD